MSQLTKDRKCGGQPVLTETAAKAKFKEIGKQQKNDFMSLK
jgi:hypothetical protein